CFYLFIFFDANAQSVHDTVQLELFPNERILYENLNRYVDTFWVEKNVVYIVFNVSTKSEAVKKAVIKSADVQKPSKIIRAKEKYDLSIDDFLNIEDETIFSDNIFLKIEKQQIHPRSYKYYCLINDIYQFSKMLDEYLDLYKDSKFEEAKQKLDEMSKLRDRILSYQYEVSCLTSKQQEYYNKLDEKYEGYWKQYKRD
ncbi:MAG: hypothetical protein IJR53_09575, partial [Bacteroidales bacterium]|nr:hypothetical protein [Bacteroidales bacterium]